MSEVAREGVPILTWIGAAGPFIEGTRGRAISATGLTVDTGALKVRR